MSRHVHLPPLPPYIGLPPLEKKEKLRRKAPIKTETSGDSSESKAEIVGEPPPSAPPASVNPSPLSGTGGLLSVLIDAQEAAQPADALTRRPPGEDED